MAKPRGGAGWLNPGGGAGWLSPGGAGWGEFRPRVGMPNLSRGWLSRGGGAWKSADAVPCVLFWSGVRVEGSRMGVRWEGPHARVLVVLKELPVGVPTAAPGAPYGPPGKPKTKKKQGQNGGKGEGGNNNNGAFLLLFANLCHQFKVLLQNPRVRISNENVIEIHRKLRPHPSDEGRGSALPVREQKAFEKPAPIVNAMVCESKR